MKILKRTEGIKYKCKNCKSKFFYTKDEIQILQYEPNKFRSYIECPVCKSACFNLNKKD